MSLSRHQQDCSGADFKRKKLSPAMDKPLTTPLSTSALLYHTALTAHQASHHHLQQAFVPHSTLVIPEADSHHLPMYHDSIRGSFYHDLASASKALGLQLFALDLLRAGLTSKDLSESEMVAFAVEFGVVGTKVITSCRVGGKGKTPVRIDIEGLITDLEDVLGRAHLTAMRQTSLTSARYRLELLIARLAFIQLDVRDNGHAEVEQLLLCARVRFLFVTRRWEAVPQALQDFERAMPWLTEMQDSGVSSFGLEASWKIYLALHYLMLAALWEGRAGSDSVAKILFRQLYILIDGAMAKGIFETLRRTGGCYTILIETVDLARAQDLVHSLSPHLCLLFGQHANFLGLDTLALRYYRACMSLINNGSELSLIAEISAIAADNRLVGILENPGEQSLVNSLAEKCKSSTSTMLTATGYFLASLIDENRVNSKKQLSSAYEITQKSNNNVLRLLIFAFTTSTHHYGGRDRMFRQLETGRDLSRLLGGQNRPDGVGQAVLGVWFALKLKDSALKAKASAKFHQARLNEIGMDARRYATYQPVHPGRS
ncbi:hypothetical protein IAU60_001106 [Kwoniella sp. DSM 27419]